MLLEDEGLGVLLTVVGIGAVHRRQCRLAITIEFYSDDDMWCLNQPQWFQLANTRALHCLQVLVVGAYGFFRYQFADQLGLLMVGLFTVSHG